MSQEKPFVSILIINHNGKKWLKECFDSLLAMSYPENRYEIILGDNASTDDSIRYVKEEYPTVRVVELPKNYGFCKANNLCAREAKGEYFAILNNDTFVDVNWLDELVSAMTKNDDIALVGGKILFPQHESGKLLNAAGGVILPSGCGNYDGWMEMDGDEWNLERNTGFVCAAGLLVRADFFNDTGGFDEYYFYSGEEMDLGYRAWALGYRVKYTPSAVMYHYMGGTGFRGKGVTPTIEYLICRNNMYFVFKNFETLEMLKGVVLYKVKALLKFVYALFRGQFRIAGAILKAHFEILFDLPGILKQRRAMQSQRKVSDLALRRLGVIESTAGMFKRSQRIMKLMKQYSDHDSYYDSRDKVRIVVDQEGERVFEEV